MSIPKQCWLPWGAGLLLLLLAVVTAWGLACDGEQGPPQRFTWTVEVDSAFEERPGTLLEVALHRGGCAEGLPAVGRWMTAWDLDAAMYSRVNEGVWGLRLRAVDSECRVYGQGCAEITLPLANDPGLQVSLAPADESALCPAEWCRVGRCGALPIPAIGRDTSCQNPSLLSDDRPPRRLALGELHSCVLVGGQLWCWGSNGQGRLGDGSQTNRLEPVAVGLEGVRSATAGNHFTCALTEEAGVWCWGGNWSGELGDGSTDLRTVPVQVRNLPDVVEIAAGHAHACGRTAEGEVFCWGDNTYGQLGNGYLRNAHQPHQVRDVSDAAALWAAGELTCVANSCGQLRCWGINATGQRGDGDFANHPLVGDIVLANVEDWAGGPYHEAHACALASGQVWCWGFNRRGQLGDGTLAGRWQPGPTLPIHRPRQVGVGKEFSCALDRAGQVYCWGWDETLALGQAGYPRSPSPASMRGVEELAVGAQHACGRRDDEVWCWGGNWVGQLGNGTTDRRSTPARVVGLPEVTEETP